jgi:antitoxin-like ribbon-helix-helix protein
MSKMQNLQQALRESTGKTPPSKEPVERAVVASPEKPKAAPQALAPRQPNRAGQVNISAWLDANYKSSLRLVQARKGNATLQDLMAEALNDLFAKYDVPTIRQE